mgnify:CR=1 FL=1
MNVGIRASLYLMRKKWYCLSLLLLLVLISSFVMTGFSTLTGTQAAKALRETVGASFQIRGAVQGGSFGESGDGYQIESTPLTEELVNQMLQVDGIKAYATTMTLPGTSDDFFFPSGAPAGQFQGNSSSEWNRDFVSGLYLLTGGRHIIPEDTAAAGGGKQTKVIIMSIGEDKYERPISIYGEPHERYIKAYRKGLYLDLLITRKLYTYLVDINEQAIFMREKIISDLAIAEGADEKLKETIRSDGED